MYYVYSSAYMHVRTQKPEYEHNLLVITFPICHLNPLRTSGIIHFHKPCVLSRMQEETPIDNPLLALIQAPDSTWKRNIFKVRKRTRKKKNEPLLNKLVKSLVLGLEGLHG